MAVGPGCSSSYINNDVFTLIVFSNDGVVYVLAVNKRCDCLHRQTTPRVMKCHDIYNVLKYRLIVRRYVVSIPLGNPQREADSAGKEN